VTCVWVQEVLPGSLPYRQRTVPNGSVDIVCALGSPVRVVGPQTGPREYDVAPGSVVVGVRLRPAAAAVVLGLPAVELVDQECSAGALWRGSAGALDEALADTTPRGAAGRLEQEVARRLADAPALDPIAVRAARCLAGARSAQVALLARRLHVSERQLRRRVEAATGLTPKALHRVVRFQRFLALAAATRRPSVHLASLANEAGYADQAHLSREAMRLEGRCPRALLLEAEQHCGCAHDHAASYAPLRTRS
jgi:AraC-like DNA-binding protein